MLAKLPCGKSDHVSRGLQVDSSGTACVSKEVTVTPTFFSLPWG